MCIRERCLCERARECVCVCDGAYMCMHICVCVCVCTRMHVRACVCVQRACATHTGTDTRLFRIFLFWDFVHSMRTRLPSLVIVMRTHRHTTHIRTHRHTTHMRTHRHRKRIHSMRTRLPFTQTHAGHTHTKRDT